MLYPGYCVKVRYKEHMYRKYRVAFTNIYYIYLHLTSVQHIHYSTLYPLKTQPLDRNVISNSLKLAIKGIRRKPFNPISNSVRSGSPRSYIFSQWQYSQVYPNLHPICLSVQYQHRLQPILNHMSFIVSAS